jgi:hypothetical protein
LEITRDAWRGVGVRASVPVVEFELVCSDVTEHRSRVENRAVGIGHFISPDWEDVRARDYHAWRRDPIRVDTTGRSIAACVRLMRSVAARAP